MKFSTLSRIEVIFIRTTITLFNFEVLLIKDCVSSWILIDNCRVVVYELLWVRSPENTQLLIESVLCSQIVPKLFQIIFAMVIECAINRMLQLELFKKE